jgi:hypothetical protein
MKHLVAIQSKLKATKGRWNSFGKYHYRSCEDILEAVKPLCAAEECVLLIADEMVQVGDRYYIKATATLKTPEAEFITTGYARESDDKKGMDASQITGTASSYARKYALNGLFCIDDNKDADTDEYQHEKKSRESKAKPVSKPVKSRSELEDEIKQLCLEKGKTIADVCNIAKVGSLADMNDERLQACIEWLAKFN